MGILDRLFKPNVEKMESTKDVGGLIKALQHKDTGIQRDAAAALGRLGNTDAVDPLIKLLQVDENFYFSTDKKDYYVRGDAAKALGDIGDRRALRALEKAVKAEHTSILSCSSFEEAARYAAGMKDRIDYIKKAAKEALEKIEAKKCEAEKVDVTEQDTHPAERQVIQEKLNVNVKELIAEADVDDWSKRNEIAHLLSKADKSEIPTLVSALQGTPWYVRESVGTALRQLGWKPADDTERILYLIATFRSNRNRDELARFGNKAIEHLQPLLEDRFKWAVGKTSEIIRTIKNVEVRIEYLKSALPADARDKILPIRTRLPDLIITAPGKAREQLDAMNAARQRVWGVQAARVPMLEGCADVVFCALLECVVADYSEKDVQSLYVEEVAAPASDDEARRLERARQQMHPDLDVGMKDFYEKKMMKHMRKKNKGRRKTTTPVREICLKLSFHHSFGPHRVIRVSEGSYYFMPCSVRE